MQGCGAKAAFERHALRGVSFAAGLVRRVTRRPRMVSQIAAAREHFADAPLSLLGRIRSVGTAPPLVAANRGGDSRGSSGVSVSALIAGRQSIASRRPIAVSSDRIVSRGLFLAEERRRPPCRPRSTFNAASVAVAGRDQRVVQPPALILMVQTSPRRSQVAGSRLGAGIVSLPLAASPSFFDHR